MTNYAHRVRKTEKWLAWREAARKRNGYLLKHILRIYTPQIVECISANESPLFSFMMNRNPGPD